MCTLNPDEEFLGVRLGMDYRQAFLALSKNAGDLTWTSYDSTIRPRRYSSNKPGIEPGDWNILQHADNWMLRDHGLPCVGFRYIFLRIVKERVDGIDVQCTKPSLGWETQH